MDVDQWLEYGYRQGWCGPPVCYTHDCIPMSEQEDNEFSDGGDPCMHIIRLYDGLEVKNSIEEHHSPSVWRALS